MMTDNEVMGNSLIYNTQPLCQRISSEHVFLSSTPEMDKTDLAVVDAGFVTRAGTKVKSILLFTPDDI